MGELKKESLDEVLAYAKRFGYIHLVSPLEELQKHQEREQLQATEEYKLGAEALHAVFELDKVGHFFPTEQDAFEVGRAILEYQKPEINEWNDIREVPKDIVVIDRDGYQWKWIEYHNSWAYNNSLLGTGSWLDLGNGESNSVTLNSWAPFKRS